MFIVAENTSSVYIVVWIAKVIDNMTKLSLKSSLFIMDIVEKIQVMKLLDAFKKDTGLTDEAIIKALTDMNAKADLKEIFQVNSEFKASTYRNKHFCNHWPVSKLTSRRISKYIYGIGL